MIPLDPSSGGKNGLRVFTVEVRHQVTVKLDESKFTRELMDEFAATITDFREDTSEYTQNEQEYSDHAKNLAELAILGRGFDLWSFIEGYGVLDEAGITLVLGEAETHLIYKGRMSPKGVGDD